MSAAAIRVERSMSVFLQRMVDREFKALKSAAPWRANHMKSPALADSADRTLSGSMLSNARGDGGAWIPIA